MTGYGKNFLMVAAATLTAANLLASSVSAATVNYTTGGSFATVGSPSSYTFGTGGAFTLAFAGNLAGAADTGAGSTLASLGTFTLTRNIAGVSFNGSLPDFTVSVNQSAPASGMSSSTASVQASIVFDAPSGTVVFNFNPATFTIAGITYQPLTTSMTVGTTAGSSVTQQLNGFVSGSGAQAPLPPAIAAGSLLLCGLGLKRKFRATPTV